ncbi:hypothetical protein [Halomonas urmiana]|uniref:hypothetical protein n=1 Tax=Halomonas urmiana TaxID=490901 RepID=UPI001873E6E9|nr:hypothetical protein [Halomonas urmiana]
MADHITEPGITQHPHCRRVRILDGDTLIADSCNAIELRECGYSPRQFVASASASVDMSQSFG